MKIATITLLMMFSEFAICQEFDITQEQLNGIATILGSVTGVSIAYFGYRYFKSK